MGTLLSCHKISKISAHTVSTQATDGALSLQPADYAMESLTKDQGVPKTVVTELNIGDGDLTNLDGLHYEFLMNKRANKENRSRPGVHRQTSPTEKSEKSNEGNAQRTPLYDYLLLPGQVSPKDGSPILTPRTEQTNRSGSPAWSYYENPADSKECTISERKNNAGQSEERMKTHRQGLSIDIPVGKSQDKRPVCTCQRRYPDENSNIMQDTLVTRQHLAHAKVYKDQQARRTWTYPKVSVLGYDSRYADITTTATSPRTTRKGRKPSNVEHAKKGLEEQSSDFPCTLEEAFQRNVPCSDDILEPSAVTGMPGYRLPQPPCGKYPISWNLKIMMKGAGGDFGTTTSRENLPLSMDLDHMVFTESNHGLGEEPEGNQLLEGCIRPRAGDKTSTSPQPLSSGEAESKDNQQKAFQEDVNKWNKWATEDPSRVAHQANVQSEEAATPLQSSHSLPTPADSCDTSDACSTKSTLSTDVDNSQSLLKDKIKQTVKQNAVQDERSVEPKRRTRSARCQRQRLNDKVTADDLKDMESRGQRDKYQDQERNIMEVTNPPSTADNSTQMTRVDEPLLSYQAIQEAVNLAVLKLDNMQTSEYFEDHEGTVSLESARNASQTSCPLQQAEEDQSQNIALDNRICSKSSPYDSQGTLQNSSAMHPTTTDTYADTVPAIVCIKEEPYDVAMVPSKSQEQSSISEDMSVHTGDGPSEDRMSRKSTEHLAGKSEDWEIVPLHRVFGQTDLAGALKPATSILQENHAAASRSVPPSAGAPIRVTEHFPIKKDRSQNTLHEELMINIALSEDRRGAAVPHQDLKPAEAEDSSRHGEGLSQQMPRLKVRASSPCISPRCDRGTNTEAPAKSPSPHMTTHEHLQLAEDIYQNRFSKSPTTHQTVSTPELALSLMTSVTDDDRDGCSPRSGRHIPRQPKDLPPRDDGQE